MRNIVILSILVLFSGPVAARAGEYDGFRAAGADVFKPFARDLGGLLGSGSNQTARPLGFSGFDLGVRAVAQFNPSHGNTALKPNNIFGLGFVQAEIGMPYRIDGFVRGGAYDGVAVAGGGLRYGLWNVSDEKYHFNAMLLGMADMAVHRYFNAIHFNTGVTCSLNVPVVAPYISAGYDFTKLQAQAMDNPALNGKTVSVAEPRLTVGFRTKLKLGYIAGGVAYTHDRLLVSTSAGFRF